jgi:hypothetical protein
MQVRRCTHVLTSETDKGQAEMLDEDDISIERGTRSYKAMGAVRPTMFTLRRGLS